MKPAESVEALALYLNYQRIAILTHYSGGKNILKFDPEYIAFAKKCASTVGDFSELQVNSSMEQ